MFFFLFLKFNNGNFSSFFFCWPVLFLSMADIFFVFSFFSTIKACFTSRTCSFARSAFFFSQTPFGLLAVSGRCFMVNIAPILF